eukprot:TRINITY_DN493_c0_g2_i2.p1 TRINITY_DN493_c0_g2~~TRINITY_DN493_c0_g2_i2.p1  ORF type:complete len:276 (-),score=102.84 TRINITY_DN493_c0_g2_i2:248-1006(-)
MLRSLVGSEMCIRDRYQRRVRGVACCRHRKYRHWMQSLPTRDVRYVDNDRFCTWNPPRTKRAEMPSIGVEDMLSFDWRNLVDDNNADPARVVPQAVMPTIPHPLFPPSCPDANPRADGSDRNVIEHLHQNIAEIRESIRELKHDEVNNRPAQDPLMMLSAALLSLTDKGQKRQRDVGAQGSDPDSSSSKKKLRMERNRQSAHKTCERKRMYTETLEKQLAVVKEENNQYRQTCEELKHIVVQLQAELVALKK